MVVTTVLTDIPYNEILVTSLKSVLEHATCHLSKLYLRQNFPAGLIYIYPNFHQKPTNIKNDF